MSKVVISPSPFVCFSRCTRSFFLFFTLHAFLPSAFLFLFAMLPFHCVPQEAAQRSLDRCLEAEAEIEELRGRLAELEGRQSGRDAVVALETKVDELEQVILVMVGAFPASLALKTYIFSRVLARRGHVFNSFGLLRRTLMGNDGVDWWSCRTAKLPLECFLLIVHIAVYFSWSALDLLPQL